MRAIFTADMEGFSTWMQRDEQAVIELLTNIYYRYADEMISRFQGVLFQKEGDAIWCTFPSADQALDAGHWLLMKFAEYNCGQSDQDIVKLRIGIASGDIDRRTLQEAKKLESSANAGAVHFSEDVRNQLSLSRGHLTGRLSVPSYESFCELKLKSQKDPMSFVLVANTLNSKLSESRAWMRAAFSAASRNGAQAYVGNRGLFVIESETRDCLEEIASLDETMSCKLLESGSTEVACQEAFPSTEPLVLERVPTSPYKFLNSFEAQDSVIFFGRDSDLDRLHDRLTASSLFILYGKSGVGKSSLLRAGLQGVASGKAVQFVTVRLLSDPITTLHQQLTRLLGRKANHSILEIWKELMGRPTQRVVLILDQFERLFLRCQENELREFVELLMLLTVMGAGRTSIIVSLREDFLAEAFELNRFWPDFSKNRMRLKGLSRESTAASIREPARLFQVEVEEKLVEVLVDSLFREGVHPAELQIVLDRLFRVRSQADQITMDDFLALGGVGQILSAYLEDALENLPGPDKERARVLLKLFVNERGSRTAVTYDNLMRTSGLTVASIESILRALVDARLVRVVSQAESLSYELVHDTLVERVKEWETPVEVARRHAQLTLRNEFRNFRRVGSILPLDRLQLLSQPELVIEPSDEERVMLVRASVHHALDPTFWMKTKAHQDLCSVSLLQMLEDQSSPPELRRALVKTLVRMSLSDRAGEVLFRYASELVNPTVLSQLHDVSERVTERLAHALQQRYFGIEAMVLVPGGPFWMGSDTACKEARKAITRPDLHSRIDSEYEKSRVELDTFRIDRCVVTNSEYAEFQPLHTHFYPPEEANFPAVNVSYEEACDYAEWLGKRLPTEQEWEKSARGTDERKFPWGNEFVSGIVNSGESERRAPLPVDALLQGASPFGCLQMSGNVWEWTSTPWESGTPLMAKKGGCALNFAPLMHCSARYEDPPEMRLRWAGFRLVSDS